MLLLAYCRFLGVQEVEGMNEGEVSGSRLGRRTAAGCSRDNAVGENEKGEGIAVERSARNE